ncbi:hypothetical protein, partial [Streptomyces microflavus]|uniref:hypothetical protein n=1 Tax=Streptomyces microflavus TaxID=1919 RepID=UPI0033BA8C9A
MRGRRLPGRLRPGLRGLRLLPVRRSASPRLPGLRLFRKCLLGRRRTGRRPPGLPRTGLPRPGSPERGTNDVSEIGFYTTHDTRTQFFQDLGM